MNRNFKVITINGKRGIYAVLFIICGLIAGFVISPGWVCMQLWNWAAENYLHIVKMTSLYQGILLWALIAVLLCGLNNGRRLIGFGAYPGLPNDQIKEIIKRAKLAEKCMPEDICRETENTASGQKLDNENEIRGQQ